LIAPGPKVGLAEGREGTQEQGPVDWPVAGLPNPKFPHLSRSLSLSLALSLSFLSPTAQKKERKEEQGEQEEEEEEESENSPTRKSCCCRHQQRPSRPLFFIATLRIQHHVHICVIVLCMLFS
jgi:hypothetical protein